MKEGSVILEIGKIDLVLSEESNVLINKALNNLEKTEEYSQILETIDEKLAAIRNNEELYYLYTMKSMYECNAVFNIALEAAKQRS